MPPIPIYAHSPINAAKADGVTPQTAAEKEPNFSPSGPPPTTTQNVPYAPAQPAAVPAIPAPTGASSLQQQHHSPPPQPTRTQPLNSHGPPPPQPGAFPIPPGAGLPQATATGLPPPPKAGESVVTTHTTTTATAAAQQQSPPAYYPPQMSIPAPPSAATQGAQRGTAGTTIAFGQAEAAAAPPLEHPPGYQQNPNASELDRYQRAAQEALEQDERARKRAPSLSDGADGVWGSVKGAMAAAGEKIAAAEEKVWKTINKDL